MKHTVKVTQGIGSSFNAARCLACRWRYSGGNATRAMVVAAAAEHEAQA